MGAADGYILGRSKVVDHGPDNQRYVIVIVGDGYTASQIEQYKSDVDTIVNQVRTTPPFDELWCAINVYRIDVVSTDSGADDPGTCGDGSAGSGATPATFFDATFCGDGQARRLLVIDSTRADQVAHAQAPEVDFTLCLVNTPIYGGSGGSVATISLDPAASDLFLHEMGHTAFGLADEYPYYTGLPGETGHDNHPALEPTEPNVTINTNSATIKWASLLTNSADPLPTTNNANCASIDPQGNPKAANYVGAYEGAHYYHCDAYRPQFGCKMRALAQPFCAVCRSVIRNTLSAYLPAESLNLVTPSISFLDIPEGVGGTGVTTYRAIVFEVVTCATRTFRISAGPTGGFGTPLGTVVAVTEADADPVAEARIWISYTSTTAGSVVSGSVTVHCDETGQDWVISITANTVARPKSAIALVLDHSGSMTEDAGIGVSKVAKLREATDIFIDAMLEGDGLAVIRFDDTAEILSAVTDVGPPVTGPGRTAAKALINGPQLDPDGLTSIGGGVQRGREALDSAQAAAVPPYDVLGMIVLTDGVENTPPMIAGVSSSINANTFAIGLGLPENISVTALDALTQGHGGYLLVTGILTDSDSARLTKYFLQILAGITNANVILDPSSVISPGAVHRIPFAVSDADYAIDVFLISQGRKALRFALETPDGQVITDVPASPNVLFVSGSGADYYRLSLPALPATPAGTHGGTWHALVELGDRFKESQDSRIRIPYDIVVHCRSNLMLRGSIRQDSYLPGSVVWLHATLREYDVPVEGRASVWATVARPDSSEFNVRLDEVEPGIFESSFATTLPGLYRVRLRAAGATFQQQAFQREQTLTVAVSPGGFVQPTHDPKVADGGWLRRFFCCLCDCGEGKGCGWLLLLLFLVLLVALIVAILLIRAL